MELYFNIHDEFKFRVIGDRGDALLNFLKKMYSFFSSDYERKLDMEVFSREDFMPSMQGTKVVNGKFFVKENSIYLNDSHKLSSWDSFIDIGSNPVKIVAKGDPFFSHRFIWRFVIESTMQYIMAKKGFIFIHASAVGKKRAHVFPAGPGGGKTSTSLNLSRRGFTFFGDDYIIIKNNVVYSYPTSIRLMDYSLDACPFVIDKLDFMERMELDAKSLACKLSLGWGKIPLDMDVRKLVNNIGTKQKIGNIIILTKTNDENLTLKTLERDNAIQKIISINELENERFNRYLSALRRVAPIKSYMDMMKKNLSSLKANYYELFIPRDVNREEISEKIMSVSK